MIRMGFQCKIEKVAYLINGTGISGINKIPMCKLRTKGLKIQD